LIPNKLNIAIFILNTFKNYYDVNSDVAILIDGGVITASAVQGGLGAIMAPGMILKSVADNLSNKIDDNTVSAQFLNYYYLAKTYPNAIKCKHLFNETGGLKLLGGSGKAFYAVEIAQGNCRINKNPSYDSIYQYITEPKGKYLDYWYNPENWGVEEIRAVQVIANLLIAIGGLDFREMKKNIAKYAYLQYLAGNEINSVGVPRIVDFEQTDANLTTNFVVNNRTVSTNYELTESDKLDLSVDIEVAPQDVGQDGSIYTVASLDGTTLMKDDKGSWLPWDGSLSNLVASTTKRLGIKEKLSIASGLSGLVGNIAVHVGYKDSQGNLVYNSQPIQFTVAETQPFIAPSNLSAIAGVEQISLSWTPVEGATAYKIYWKVVGMSQWQFLQENTTSSFMHQGLWNPNETYFYSVTAVASNGTESAFSNEVSATPQAQNLPVIAPSNLSAIAGVEQISLSWTPVEGAIAYDIYWKVVGMSQWQFLQKNTASSFIHQGLVNPNETYFYKVTAVASNGTESTFSNEVSATPQAQNLPEVFQDTLKDGSSGPEMVWIPAGTFRMGDIQGDGNKNEQPVHTVSVEQFAMGRYEVTFAQYDRFAEATGREKPRDEGWGRGNRPVIYVTWNDATAYAEWLSNQTGRQYRLPTEAEWEYAARAGTETKYWWGNTASHEYANYDGEGSTSLVGSFLPNPFGLYDILGNVWEWTCSAYDGDGPDFEFEKGYKGSERYCVNTNYNLHRGGSFANGPEWLRVSARIGYDYDSGNYLRKFLNVGFRVVAQ